MRSPTPWMVDDDTHVLDAKGRSVLSETDGEAARGETYSAEDARFIVQAVNDYGRLRSIERAARDLVAEFDMSSPCADCERAKLDALRGALDASPAAGGEKEDE